MRSALLMLKAIHLLLLLVAGGILEAADWVGPVEEEAQSFGVYFFRNEFEVEEVPEALEVKVTADNRYRLYLNGEELVYGPAAGDLARWRFETVDLAPKLKAGTNVLAAEVWNFGEHKPVAQVTARTGFRVESTRGDLETGNGGWRMLKSQAHAPEVQEPWKWAGGWYAVGAGERQDGRKLPGTWKEGGFDDAEWTVPTVIVSPQWRLERRPIPLFGWERFDFSQVVEGDRRVTWEGGIEFPAGSETTVLLDLGKLAIGDPVFVFDGGRDAEVGITYAESPLSGEDLRSKGNRNVTAGAAVVGHTDVYFANGSSGQRFRPLQWRCARYVKLTVITAAEPLKLADAFFRFSAYPFEQRAEFRSSDPALDRIFRVGVWTQRNCAHETYMDCPYYERLDYPGDTYVQARTTMAVFGDDRLIRNSIGLYPGGRDPRGFVMSAYPQQRLDRDDGAVVIPNYSLSLADMIHEHYWFAGDAAFTRRQLPLIDDFLSAYAAYVDEERGMLGPVPGWTFIDWSWKAGGPNGCDKEDPEGYSSILTMLYLRSLQKALDLHERLGPTPHTERWRRLSAMLQEGVWRNCYDSERKLLVDHPELGGYSQHAQILGVLTGTLPEDLRERAMLRALGDESVRRCTGFFKVHLFEALRQLGLGALFYEQLGEYHLALSKGLTTFSEALEQRMPHDRSDCHAWVASPTYEVFASTLGITPTGPGYSTVLIRPNLGPLRWAEGEMATPQGGVRVKLARKGPDKRDGREPFEVEVTLPEGVSGEFEWYGVRRELQSGTQAFSFERP